MAADFEADVADGFLGGLGGKRKSRHSAETWFFAKTRFLKSSTLSRKSVFSKNTNLVTRQKPGFFKKPGFLHLSFLNFNYQLTINNWSCWLAADFEADVADGFLGGKRKSRYSAETWFFAKTRFLESSTLSRKSVFSKNLNLVTRQKPGFFKKPGFLHLSFLNFNYQLTINNWSCWLAADFEADVADGFLGGKRKSRYSAETWFFAKTRFLESSTLSINN